MSYLIDLAQAMLTRDWLHRGWWEIRCTCGCGARMTVPGLVCLRSAIHHLHPGRPYTVIRFGRMACHWRERARFGVKVTWGGRVRVQRIRAPQRREARS